MNGFTAIYEKFWVLYLMFLPWCPIFWFVDKQNKFSFKSIKFIFKYYIYDLFKLGLIHTDYVTAILLLSKFYK